jgi:ribosomal protein L37E
MWHHTCPNCGNSSNYKTDDHCPACGYLHPKEVDYENEKEAVTIEFCPECGCRYFNGCKIHKRAKATVHAKDDADKTNSSWQEQMVEYIKLLNEQLKP